MRTVKILDQARFCKGDTVEQVRLPHTWNAKDGQDGGNDYYRGRCTYEISLPDPTPGKRQFIQFDGANHMAKVSCNGIYVGTHRGGFSTFRFELTAFLKERENMLLVEVDNKAPNVYPQQADFTFFGGLYRDVSFIEVEQAHISLMIEGSEGVFVTPESTGRTRVDVFVTDASGCTASLTIRDHSTKEKVAEASQKSSERNSQPITFWVTPECITKWDGIKNPFLYEAEVCLTQNGVLLDRVMVLYGYRTFEVDWENGFFLNQNRYPLHGVSRHQDRQGKGWAITAQDHQEDMQFIRQIGANAVRLAHYQHSQEFYNLCDENGIVVWAEIPFISSFLEGEEARENSLSQLRELIIQNYNHPSICFWGIGNEMTIGPTSKALEDNLWELHHLAKKLDPSRLTTIAHLSTLNPENVQCKMTDVMGYNIYCGWYTGRTEENGEILDSLHEKLFGRPLALSEYGADALIKWHSAKPKNHDYTEEYQAFYHETMLKTFETRPWLWGTFVWNLFDFAADARAEGGCEGRNTKGLVTYDRANRKDAFYIYQAYWSPKPMVHICGARFVNRAAGERDIKVYTNCEKAELLLNGHVFKIQDVTDHVCVFENVPLLIGQNTIEVYTEKNVSDRILLNGVQESDKAYIMPEEELIAGNWFDEETGETMTLEYPEGYYSIKDTLGDILKNQKAAGVFGKLKELMGRQEAVSSNNSKKSDSNSDTSASSKQNQAQADSAMMKSLNSIPLQQLIKLGGMKLDPAVLIRFNRELNQIPKERKEQK